MNHFIGIPRGLDFYLHYPFWQSFLAALGVPTIVSPPTNRRIVDLGAAHAVDGCCLPLKVYLGHVLTLAEQGVKTFFVPQIISIVRREYICPYFLGLPDFVAHYLPKAGTSILSPVVDARRGELAAAKKIIAFGTRFGSWLQSAHAYHTARAAVPKATVRLDQNRGSAELKVLLLGHRYLLGDSFLNQGIRDKLQEAAVEVITADQIPDTILSRAAGKLPKRVFWTSGRQSLGALERCLEDVDGVITLAAFACGPDSLISDVIQRRARQAGVPSLLIYVDEHTGQAGFGTRIEAFMDMLVRRKAK
ncbi:MAG: hypothetical protein GX195_08330 [Firmicutes bacterium]|jgi:predicted nucleotide-binding protein (sugar kinase/HSP70/actin superfamily)|nr:hypothetical protein [Bacillota bacterium]